MQEVLEIVTVVDRRAVKSLETRTVGNARPAYRERTILPQLKTPACLRPAVETAGRRCADRSGRMLVPADFSR